MKRTEVNKHFEEEITNPNWFDMAKENFLKIGVRDKTAKCIW